MAQLEFRLDRPEQQVQQVPLAEPDRPEQLARPEQARPERQVQQVHPEWLVRRERLGQPVQLVWQELDLLG